MSTTMLAIPTLETPQSNGSSGAAISANHQNEQQHELSSTVAPVDSSRAAAMEPLVVTTRHSIGSSTLTSTLLPPTTTANITTAATSTATHASSSTATATVAVPSSSSSSAAAVAALQRGRTYRISTSGGATNKWVTRELAALDFLLNIPMDAERSIIENGWVLQQQQDDFYEHRGRGHRVPKLLTTRQSSQDRSNNNDNKDDDGDDEEAKRTEDEALLEPPTSSQGGRWWEKLVGEAISTSKRSNSAKEGGGGETIGTNMGPMTDGEQPNNGGEGPLQPPQSQSGNHYNNRTTEKGLLNKDDLQVVPLSVPSRRLDGDDAFFVQIPLKVDTMTRQRLIARQAAIREWEQKVAYGLIHHQQQRQSPPMLDGRMFFSAAGSYPVGVFSVLRYEPRKEEEARLRQKLEARGGGGTQFAVPERDWRGTSYRALLPRINPHHSSFHRFLQHERKQKQRRLKRKNKEKGDDDHDDDDDESDDEDNGSDDDSISSNSSSEASDTYFPGFLDDPEMVQGRHRNLMIGDRNTGCIIVSTIQFVEPALLKADLNKQFRERFESWEPPKSQRKYIGARVMDGVYTLMETEEHNPSSDLGGGSGGGGGGGGNSGGVGVSSSGDRSGRRSRQSSVTHVGGVGGGGSGSVFEDKDTFRMPPSLTLSKIRSVKQQALLAAVKAKLEISTVALACIYFERLCLDCRVDKTNRRLCFASCLLLSMKINETYVGLVTPGGETQEDGTRRGSLHSLIRTTNKSQTMFASLLEFFTQDWQLSLKQLFAAEWGVFAALGFSLHANPTHVAFHFKRLMKTLEWNIPQYLGREMYSQWQDVLEDEESRRRSRERRREIRRKRKEKNLIALQRELQAEADRRERRLSELHKSGWNLADDSSQPEEVSSPTQEPVPSTAQPSPSKEKLSSTTHHKSARIKLFNRLSMKTSASQGKIHTSVDDQAQQSTSFTEIGSRRKRLSLSPSMPLFTSPPPPNTPPLGMSRHVAVDVQDYDSERMADYDSDEGIIV